MQSNDQTPPVKPGEELDVMIESVGEKGDGVAKKQGFVIFVPKAQKGDQLHIKITKVLKSVSFAENLGPAKGPVVNAPREYKERPKYQQPKREEDVDYTKLGEGSEEF
jgi:predicted RNA-binding protein with TRAM domain